MEEENLFMTEKEYEDRLTKRIQNLYKQMGESENKKKEFNDTLVRGIESKNIKVIYLPTSQIEPENIIVNSGINYFQFGFGNEENGILIAPCIKDLTEDEYKKYIKKWK